MDILPHRDDILLDERKLAQALASAVTARCARPWHSSRARFFVRLVPYAGGIYLVRKNQARGDRDDTAWAALESMAARRITADALSTKKSRGLAQDVFATIRKREAASQLAEYSELNINSTIRLSLIRNSRYRSGRKPIHPLA